MKVKVLTSFIDKKNKIIQPEEKVIEMSEKRFEEINSLKNGLVEIITDDGTGEGSENGSEFPKHTGGGWYELSNGEKVQGKDEAIKAEIELKENK